MRAFPTSIDSRASTARPAVRALVLCADIGEGHLTVARSLVEALARRQDVEAVQLRSDLEVLGPRLGRFLTDGFQLHLDQVGWSYELAYRVFFERASGRRAGHLALAAMGGPGLRRTLADCRADVVVTEYPVLSAALGQLRALGRMPIPVCSSISDPAGLYYWAHRGIDLHLLSWPESLGEVASIAGPGRAAPVRPLIDRRFLEAPPGSQARAKLRLPQAGRVLLVSGGGWGLGDLEGAAQVALSVDPEATVICLAGRSERTRQALLAAHGGDTRVRVLGYSDLMPELLAASDVLIHTTGGTTALEARMVGCPLVNYGGGPAHVRAHGEAMAEQGLAEWAPSRATLEPALMRALASERREPLPVDGLPEAAELVVQLALAAKARSATGGSLNQRAASARASAAGRAA